MKRRKGKQARKSLNATPSAAGNQIRGIALGYDKSGQHEHAAGMRQAADIADKLGTGGVQDQLDYALKQIDEAIRVLSTVRSKVRAAGAIPSDVIVKADVEGTPVRGKRKLSSTRADRLPSSMLNAPIGYPEPTPTNGASKPILSACERAILTALKARGRPTSKVQLGILARYRHTSGSFNKALADLRPEYIDLVSPSIYTITKTGEDIIGHVAPLPSGAEAVAFWAEELGACAGAILKVVYKAHPNEVDAESLAQAAGELVNGVPYSARSGSFNKALADLRKLELMVGLRASDELMAATVTRAGLRKES